MSAPFVASAGRAREWRRAQPWLGTLVEIGITGADDNDARVALCDTGFLAIAGVQRCLSRFEADSDIARFNIAPAGTWIDVAADTLCVLGAARRLHDASHGLFDVSLGRAPGGWSLQGRRLHKLDAHAQLDLGGIGKGHAVDRAVQALIAAGAQGGWVNAGGDLRTFGDVPLRLQLRDEQRGGAIDFGQLRSGAFATSRFGDDARAVLSLPSGLRSDAHVSVAAPLCLWADALTKVVAASRDCDHPLLTQFGARAWMH